MINWFSRSSRKNPGQDFREVPIQEILERLSNLEEALGEVKEKLGDKYWSIDRVNIEKMHADKVEFNLDSIDVKDLSGMLSIGLNYGGKQIKMESSPAEKKQQPQKKTTKDDADSSKTDADKKDTAPHSRQSKAGTNDVKHEATSRSAKTGPAIKMTFK